MTDLILLDLLTDLILLEYFPKSLDLWKNMWK